MKIINKILGTISILGVAYSCQPKETSHMKQIISDGFPKNYTIDIALFPTRSSVIYVKQIPGEHCDSLMVDPKTKTVSYSGLLGYRVNGDDSTKLREDHGTVIGRFANDSIDLKFKK